MKAWDLNRGTGGATDDKHRNGKEKRKKKRKPRRH